jgi:hypothetical protein
MIFGFNTDIKTDTTVYHVQTEVREQERRLESQVFVSGRCIGKRSASTPGQISDEEVQELARAQHRWVVEAVREGFVEDVLDSDDSLIVQFLGAQRITGEDVILHFRILSGGAVVASAEVKAKWKTEESSGELGGCLSNEAGIAQMRFTLTNGTAELEVEASLEGRKATRRFLLKSARS